MQHNWQLTLRDSTTLQYWNKFNKYCNAEILPDDFTTSESTIWPLIDVNIAILKFVGMSGVILVSCAQITSVGRPNLAKQLS